MYFRPKQCLFKFSNAFESSSDILEVSINSFNIFLFNDTYEIEVVLV